VKTGGLGDGYGAGGPSSWRREQLVVKGKNMFGRRKVKNVRGVIQ
jgi:hypothetical protein